MQGGLHPEDYVDNGFYHFGGKYTVQDFKEFEEITEKLKFIILKSWLINYVYIAKFIYEKEK